MEDVYIKDEGDFATVCFMTEKAKELIKKELSHTNLDALYGNNILKMDVIKVSVIGIINWCISHNLVFNKDY